MQLQSMDAAVDAAAYPYEGPEELRACVDQALRSVVDTEVALNIVDVGLVFGVRAAAGRVDVRVTMTSPACPVADVILEDIEHALDVRLPEGWLIHVELEWEQPWSPERMSTRAKAFMGW